MYTAMYVCMKGINLLLVQIADKETRNCEDHKPYFGTEFQ